MVEGTWTIKHCDPEHAASLVAALDLTDTTASVLVRRGYADPEQAKAFLDGELPGHDPFALGDMREACERIRAAIDAGTKICVHGDYDVDGICATTLAVLVLRELGADVEWHLPSRFEEGYGLAARPSRVSPGLDAGSSSPSTAGSLRSRRSRPPGRRGSR